MIAFTHGVASGDPTYDGAMVWTRAIDTRDIAAPVRMTCVVADAATGLELDRVVIASDPNRDGTARVDIGGLLAGRRYAYWFEAGGRRSQAGRFITLPDNGRELTFAVVSCAKYNAGFFNAYRRIAARSELDFVLHLGDYIYEAANVPPRSQTPGAEIGRDFDPLHECFTLADYRRRYAQYRADVDLQALHASHAVIATIDDHEIADNAWGGGAEEHREDLHGPWSERVRNALTAWEDWMPTRCRPTKGDSINRSFAVGPLATIAVLDTRSHRSSVLETDPLRRTQLGSAQREWLAGLAQAASTRWLIIGMPSTLTPLWCHSHDAAALNALRTLKIAATESDAGYYDLWDAFPHERERLLDIMESSESSPLLLSGDLHVSLATAVRREGRQVAVEWTTPSLTSQNLDDKMGWLPRTSSLAAEASVLRALPNLSFCNFDDHGYVVVTLNESRATGEWWFVGSVRKKCATECRGHTESTCGRDRT